MLTTSRMMDVLEATWPPAERAVRGGWVLRRGAGGGKRVSAASGAGDIAEAEAGMAAWGQAPLFQLLPEETALDAALEERGYRVVDPTRIYAAPVAAMVGEQSHQAAAYTCEFRPAIMEEIWAAGGIGPARLAVMDRVAGPSAFLMSRADDRPVGVAFVAVAGDAAMIHAIEVLDRFRRKGAARLLMEAGARFARDHDARTLALAVTEANAPANTLYRALGMEAIGRYHYRVKGDGDF